MLIDIGNCDPDEPKWYIPVATSGVLFFTGLALILFGRFIKFLLTPKKKKNEPEEKKEVQAKAGLMTRIQDWAFRLNSGKNTAGQIMV